MTNEQLHLESGGRLAIFIVCSIAIVLVTIFYILFSNRLLAYIICRLLYFWKLEKEDVSLSIGSFSLAPLGGKILIRGFRYITPNYCISFIDGVIEVNWWFIFKSTWRKTKQECRLRLYLNGLEIISYNNTAKMDYIDKLNRGESITPEAINLTEYMKEDSLQKLFGWVKSIGFDIHKCHFVFGNPELPTFSQFISKRIIGICRLDKAPCEDDLYRFLIDMDFGYSSFHFKKLNQEEINNVSHSSSVKYEAGLYSGSILRKMFPHIPVLDVADFTEDPILEHAQPFEFVNANPDKESNTIDEETVFRVKSVTVKYYYDKPGMYYILVW
jgi:hypothetical protein